MKSNNNILSFMTITDLPFVINNWYFKAYCKIINNTLKENRKKLKQNDPQYVYYESHHIIPKSLGGNDDKSNLVLLNKYEHFLVHWLLTKCISGRGKYSMMNAFDKMLSKGKGQERYIPKHKFAKIIKQNKEGIKRSEESIKKQKETISNKTLEEKAIEYKNRSEAAIKREANKTLEEKADITRKIKKIIANKTPEEKADIIRKTKETCNNKTPEEKDKWKRKRIEARAYKYTQEETDFILQQKSLGLSLHKITKAFNEKFRKQENYISVSATYNHIRRTLKTYIY